MMRQMRQNTKWIMLVTALAFVALMVFEWGMDITGRTGGLGEIGRVNGQPVMYDEYIATYRNLVDDVQRRQGQPLTGQQNRQLEDEAWDQIVVRLLIEQELRRRGIQVTDEEIRDAALYSPPPAFAEAAEFRTDGEFDLQKYQSYIRSPMVDNETLLYLEAYYRDVIPRGKLMRQLTSGVYPTDAELWQEWRDRNEQAVVSYLSLNPMQRIADSDVSLTDREIRQYYDGHRDDFRRPAQASMRVVTLGKAPTAADTAASFERARRLRQEILEGANFAELAERESSDPGSAPEGGSLGTFGRDWMVQPLEEAAFSAPVGQVTEPVETVHGLHLIEVQSRTADSVTARHILIPIERTEESELRLLATADSLERATDRQPLEAAAATFGLEVRTATVNSDFAFLPGAGQVWDGLDWALEEASPGEVSPLFETPESFYVMELVEASRERTLSLEEARPTIEQVLRTRKKIEQALDEGRSLVAKVRAGATLSQVAAEHALRLDSAGPFSRTDLVPTLGIANAAVGAAFGLPTGGVSEPVAAGSNVFILEKVSHHPADSTEWLEQKELQRQQVTMMTQERRMNEWLEGIRAQARIIDRRREVLQPAEEEPLGSRGLGGPFGR